MLIHISETSHMPQFNELLVLIETLLSISNPFVFADCSQNNPAPPFEQGIIMALCFLALKCPYLSLRERALEIMLYRAPERR